MAIALSLLWVPQTTEAMVLGIDMGAAFMKVALVKPGSPFQVGLSYPNGMCPLELNVTYCACSLLLFFL